MGRETQPLLPIRHAQKDLFICDLFDTWKDDQGSMEHPIFSLSTKPDKKRRKYDHNGNTLEIIPSDLGLATIHDKDVLLYLASHIMSDLNTKQKEATRMGEQEIEAPPKRLRFTAYDMLVLTNRSTSKLGYERLVEALRRLSGTRIETNIKTNGKIQLSNFGIIDSFGIIREDQSNPQSRMVAVEINLSDWFYNAILGQEVLTINPDYFRLRKPIERRIYELCRKHCGTNQSKFTIGLEKLKKKSGYHSPLKHFRSVLKKIITSNHMPDYELELDNDNLIVRPRVSPKPAIEQNKIYLKPQTYETAEKILSKHRLDKYAVEAEWLEWISGKEKPTKPDGAFIGFCKFKVDSL